MMFGTGVNTAATVSGYTGEMARTALLNYCTKLTPMSAALCLSFLLKTYNITDAADNQERLIRLSYAFGKNFVDRNMGKDVSLTWYLYDNIDSSGFSAFMLHLIVKRRENKVLT